jgi:hypothetical protein
MPSGTGSFSQTYSGTSATSPHTLTYTYNGGAGTPEVLRINATNNPSAADTLSLLKLTVADVTTAASTVRGLDIDVTTANANDTTYAAILQGGNVGIGTTNKLSRLTVVPGADVTNIGGTTTANNTQLITGSGTTFLTSLAVGDRISLSSAASTYATVTAIASDTSLTVDTALGNGTSQTINAKRSVFRLEDSANVPQVVVDDRGITSVNSLNLGAASIDTNAGIVSWMDLPVTSSQSAGTVQSYTAQIDSTPLLTVYAESDGAGGIQNSRVKVDTRLSYTPSATQAITAATNTILANAALVVLDPNGNYTMTSAPTIADGATGQLVYITCANAEANTVTVQDQDTLASSNLQLGASTRAISGKDVLALLFDGTDWIEVSYANN